MRDGAIRIENQLVAADHAQLDVFALGGGEAEAGLVTACRARAHNQVARAEQADVAIGRRQCADVHIAIGLETESSRRRAAGTQRRAGQQKCA